MIYSTWHSAPRENTCVSGSLTVWLVQCSIFISHAMGLAPSFDQCLNPLIGFGITKNTLLLAVTCPSFSSLSPLREGHWIDFISALFNVTISWSRSSSHLSGMTTSPSPSPASGKPPWSWNNTHFFFFLGVSSDILAISLLVSNSSLGRYNLEEGAGVASSMSTSGWFWSRTCSRWTALGWAGVHKSISCSCLDVPELYLVGPLGVNKLVEWFETRLV